MPGWILQVSSRVTAAHTSYSLLISPSCWKRWKVIRAGRDGFHMKRRAKTACLWRRHSQHAGSHDKSWQGLAVILKLYYIHSKYIYLHSSCLILSFILLWSYLRYDFYIEQRKPDPAENFCSNWVTSAAEGEHCRFPTLLGIVMNDSGDNLIYSLHYSINLLNIFVIL